MTKFKVFVVLLAICSIVLSSCKSSKDSVLDDDKIHLDKQFAFDFVKSGSLSPVLDKAEEEGKLVFLDIYTSWCLPCKMMEEDVFTNEGTADVINADYISYKVDAEKDNGPDLAAIYQVKSYPTLLFLDPKGRVLERKEGAAYHRELLELAASAREKYPSFSSVQN